MSRRVENAISQAYANVVSRCVLNVEQSGTMENHARIKISLMLSFFNTHRITKILRIVLSAALELKEKKVVATTLHARKS